jgi:hypothetical protein
MGSAIVKSVAFLCRSRHVKVSYLAVCVVLIGLASVFAFTRLSQSHGVVQPLSPTVGKSFDPAVTASSTSILVADEVVSAIDTSKLLEIAGRAGTATVEGKVVRSYYARSSNGAPTFFDFHEPYDGYFASVIWGDDRAKFPPNPEIYYLNKMVRIMGLVQMYKGAPEIILRDRSQIWTVN